MYAQYTHNHCFIALCEKERFMLLLLSYCCLWCLCCSGMGELQQQLHVWQESALSYIKIKINKAVHMKICCSKPAKMWQLSDKDRYTIITTGWKHTPCNRTTDNIVCNMLKQLMGNTRTYILQNILLLLKFCDSSLHGISTKLVCIVTHWENIFSLMLTKPKSE